MSKAFRAKTIEAIDRGNIGLSATAPCFLDQNALRSCDVHGLPLVSHDNGGSIRSARPQLSGKSKKKVPLFGTSGSRHLGLLLIVLRPHFLKAPSFGLVCRLELIPGVCLLRRHTSILRRFHRRLQRFYHAALISCCC